MSNLERRLYEELKVLRRRFHMCAEHAGSDPEFIKISTPLADQLIEECKAKEDAESAEELEQDDA